MKALENKKYYVIECKLNFVEVYTCFLILIFYLSISCLNLIYAFLFYKFEFNYF